MTAATTDLGVAVGTSRRVLPQNMEAEMSVVGGVLVGGVSVFSQVADLVSAADFLHPTLGAIYQAMVELDARGAPIDPIAVGDQMRASDTHSRLRAFGGEAYFAELMTQVVTVDNIAFHAKIVHGKATVRQYIEAGQSIAARGYSDYGDVDEFADYAEGAIFAVAQRSLRKSFRAVGKALPDVISALEQRFEQQRAVTGVSTGYGKLDALTAGWQPSDLVIIAGRPSMGKTAFSLNSVLRAAVPELVNGTAVRPAVPALVFSLEMDEQSIVERLISIEGRVDSARLRSGFLDQRDWINLTKATARIHTAPLYIDDSGAPSLVEIRSKTRRWRADPRLFPDPAAPGIIVVDYLQLVAPSEGGKKGRTREQEISEISRGLKALAKELRVPILALSQLNRAVEARADKRPLLSDLRESGAIEQDADVIVFLYRDEVYHPDGEDLGTAEAIVAKQRKGATGTVRLAFLNQYTRFENLADDRAPP